MDIYVRGRFTMPARSEEELAKLRQKVEWSAGHKAAYCIVDLDGGEIGWVADTLHDAKMLQKAILDLDQSIYTTVGFGTNGG